MTLLTARGLVLDPLDGLDLDLPVGLTAVVGEDGCGAGLLLRVLAGLDRAAAGTVSGGPVALLPAPSGADQTDEVVTDALDAPHLVGRVMATLSGGERQRVRLARLLADPAPVLLLDEPFGYLDRAGIAVALEALRLAAQERAVLIACLADPVAARTADRVLLLEEGRLRPWGGRPWGG